MAMKNITDKQVCEAVFDAWNINEYRSSALSSIQTLNVLMERTGECEKVCFRAMERALDRRFLECGVSIRTAWLTEKGELLIGK